MIDERIKTGICAFGMSGKVFHAPFLQVHPGFELTAMVERSREEARKIYPHSIIYKSIEALLADKSIQLVIVNTPVQTHYMFAKAALEAGKHVVIEKPMTVTAAEALELIALAKNNNLLLSVFQNRRYDGDFKAVAQVVQGKLLGTIKEVEISFNRYREGASGKVHKEGALPGAGMLHDLGAHLIDQALVLFGMPTAVFADLMTLRTGVIANDYFEVLLYYKDLRVRVKSSMLAREILPAYVLHGTKGSFIQERSDPQEAALAAGAIPSLSSWLPVVKDPDGLLYTVVNGTVERKKQFSTPGNYMNFYSDLHLALTGKAANPIPGEAGLAVIEVINAALRSYKMKKLIEL